MASLEMMVSAPGTGKTTRCIELFREHLARSSGGIDARAYFVLPSREHAERIQSLILRKDVQGLFNAHVLTIQDLADRLLTAAGAGRPTESVRRAAVAEALSARDAAGETVYGFFRESLALRGFQELALEAVREFKAGLVSARDFDRRAQKLRKKDPVFASKHRDFSILLKRYDAKLASLGLSEAEDDLRALAPDDLPAGEAPDLVIFDGFYHFTRAQKKLLALVSGWASRTVVTLTLDRAHPGGEALFGYPLSTRAFLTGLGFAETPGFDANHRVADPGLRHLAAHLFAPAPPAYGGRAPVTVLSAPSRRAEFEMIAREIRRLYRTRAGHFSDFCVILRAASGRRALIESVFSEYGVPVSIHERARLVESGVGASLARFLRLEAEGWKREDVAYLAKSSYFRALLTPADALDLERAALRVNLSAGAAGWSALLASGVLPPGAAGFLRALLDAAARVLAAKGPGEFAAGIQAFIRTPAAAAGDDALDAAAMRQIATLLASGRRRYSTGGEAFAADRYVHEVLAAVENGLVSRKPQGRNRVQVYDAVMALPKEYKTVFVADLLEKTFPQPVTEDPLFKDEERRSLNGDDPALDERGRRLSGERYFFYMAVTRAREHVYFTHSTHDDDGKPALRSFFVDEALRCFAPSSIERREKGPSDFLPGPAEWETAADVVRGLAGIARLPESARPPWYAALAPRPEFAVPLGKALAARPQDGPVRLRDPRALEALRAYAGPFSATGFDAFYKCAFRHFAEALLRLRRPPEGFEDAEMGDVLHKVLHDYFSAMPRERLESGAYRRDPGAMERELEALLDARFADAFGDQPAYRRSVFRGTMGAMLRAYAGLERSAAAPGFVPSRFEYAFGKEGADYLRLADASGEILLKGSIDRIDVDAEARRAIVIDYKKSSRKLKDKLKKGEEIQLPLYALAARRLLGLEPAGIEHRVMKTGRVESAGLTSEQLSALIDETETRIREAVRRIRGGEIAVEPKECDFCPFDAVCRVDARKDRRGR